MASIILALALLPAPATLMRIVAEGTDSAVHQRVEVVIRTPVEWEALWGRLASGKPPEPVDFAHEMLVAVSVPPVQHGARSRVRTGIVSVLLSSVAVAGQHDRSRQNVHPICT